MKIKANSVVSIEYELRDDEGTLMDASEDEPLVYLHGHQNIIPGLEKALEAKGKGDQFKVRIEPSDAYGQRNVELVRIVKRDQLQFEGKIEPGMQFSIETDEGEAILFVTEVNETKGQVTLDGNHPLAGIALNFTGKITDIRDASAEEVSHGHVHGPHGHHH